MRLVQRPASLAVRHSLLLPLPMTMISLVTVAKVDSVVHSHCSQGPPTGSRPLLLAYRGLQAARIPRSVQRGRAVRRAQRHSLLSMAVRIFCRFTFKCIAV